MRSLIILEVEHGENTDDLTNLTEYLASNSFLSHEENLVVINYTVRVDLPDCFELKE